MYWQSTVSSRLTLKERGIRTRFPVFILGVYFHWLILKRCIGRVLLVRGSRLKNEVYIHVSQCLSSVFIFTDWFWNSVYWQSTVSSRLTLKERGILTRFPVFIPRCLFSLIDFEIRCIGRVLLVRGSLLKNEHTRFPVFILGVYFHWINWRECSVTWNARFCQTTYSRLTLSLSR